MPSNRIALLAVVAGAGLLGFTSGSVTAIADNAADEPSSTPVVAPQHPGPGHHPHHGHGGL